MPSETDTALARPRDIPTAIGLLTRLPVPMDPALGAQAAWAYPLAGLVVGGLAGLVALALLALGLPAPFVAGAILTTQILLTGALHEDGLADCADGFWGAWDIPRRLDIMRDSRIGTYGVLALVLCVLLRWAALIPLMALAPGLLMANRPSAAASQPG